MNKKTEYASYNAMSRPALIYGVPLLPLLFLGFLIIGSAFIGILNFGLAKGISVPFILSIPIVFMKIQCEQDPRALDSLRWQIQGFFFKLKQGSVMTVFVTGSEKLRTKYAYRFFKEIKQKYPD